MAEALTLMIIAGILTCLVRLMRWGWKRAFPGPQGRTIEVAGGLVFLSFAGLTLAPDDTGWLALGMGAFVVGGLVVSLQLGLLIAFAAALQPLLKRRSRSVVRWGYERSFESGRAVAPAGPFDWATPFLQELAEAGFREVAAGRKHDSTDVVVLCAPSRATVAELTRVATKDLMRGNRWVVVTELLSSLDGGSRMLLTADMLGLCLPPDLEQVFPGVPMPDLLRRHEETLGHLVSEGTVVDPIGRDSAMEVRQVFLDRQVHAMTQTDDEELLIRSQRTANLMAVVADDPPGLGGIRS